MGWGWGGGLLWVGRWGDGLEERKGKMLGRRGLGVDMLDGNGGREGIGSRFYGGWKVGRGGRGM